MVNLTTDIDAIVFDFDGVLTDNKVLVDQHGTESVTCSRADGLAFDLLRKLTIPSYILSTEKNSVVTARANKLNVPVFQGIGDKRQTLSRLISEKSYDFNRICYVGNDLNDYYAMQVCGIRICPADSHPLIKQLSTHILSRDGGDGVARELIENYFEQNFLTLLYP
jgi:YrbI family 3-deoxy-D-manno-octulosonate 8-phosphate phosphatase